MLVISVSPPPSALFLPDFAAPFPRPVLFFDCSSIVLRLYSVFKTKNNRRTNGDKTANNTRRGEGATTLLRRGSKAWGMKKG
ncbi:MAG: hypothetical protein J6X88_06550 [Bacteroidales bacterium]|nr:hypothetical protein [Bacteroidales bacterium]